MKNKEVKWNEKKNTQKRRDNEKTKEVKKKKWKEKKNDEKNRRKFKKNEKWKEGRK